MPDPPPAAVPTSDVAGAATGKSPSATPVNAIDPAHDQRQLAAQGSERPTNDGSIGTRPGDVYSEDWWSFSRPIVELHGYFRTRAELLHNFSLGRHDTVNSAVGLWPRPLDDSYVDTNNLTHGVNLCGDNANRTSCSDKSQATANLRLRLNPEIHITDNLRILTQLDLLDNLVLGSTPDAYALKPQTSAVTAATGSSGYTFAGYNNAAPLGAFSNTQGPPTAGVNGYRNSIDVKRVWAEYLTPVGQVRFGRMPNHWGLGMVNNSGDGYDSDYQTTTDRIMFVTGIKSIDLYMGGAWDFLSSGPTSATPYDVNGGQPYSTANLANANEWALFVARRSNPELQRLALSRGEVVFNGGIYAVYRSQLLDVQSSATGKTPWTTGADPTNNNGLERRGLRAFVPDLWLQLLWKKLRIEAEFATTIGTMDAAPQTNGGPTDIRQFGLTTQTEFRAIEDKLRLNFGFGWASGDPWAASLSGSSQELNGKGPITTFAFHPDYRVDLIFFRQILKSVEGAYYFRPSVEYDFLRSTNGQKLGGGASVIWSRASEFIQTPGQKRDLGIELDGTLYYQAKDGSLNDDPNRMGGFYAMLQYGVFFPMGGLSYLSGEQTAAGVSTWDTSAAQTVRLYLGVLF